MEAKPIKIVPACGKCVCYVQSDGVQLAKAGVIGTEKQGQCHRFPPQVVAVSHKTLEGMALVPGAMFPQVGDDWWCGEFRPRTPPKAANEA